MSRVDKIAEAVKLGRVLRRSPESLAALDVLGAGAMRTLREQISDALFDDTRPALERVSKSSKLLPDSMVARLGERFFGAMLCARITGLLTPERAAALAAHMPDTFLADVAIELDPRCAREVIARLTVERVVAVALVLLERHEYVTMGRLVDYIAPEAVQRVIETIDDPGVILQIAFYIERKAQLGELAGMLSETLLRNIVVHASHGDGSSWVEALALMGHLDGAWQERIGDIVVAEGPDFIAALVGATVEYDLWASMLSVVGSMSPHARVAVASTPALGTPQVLTRVVAVAHEEGRWPDLLPLVDALHEDARGAAAAIVGTMPDEVILAMIESAHAQSLFPSLLGIVVRMSDAEATQAIRVLTQQSDEVIASLASAVDPSPAPVAVAEGEPDRAIRWSALLPHMNRLGDDDLRRLLEQLRRAPSAHAALLQTLNEPAAAPYVVRLQLLLD